MPSPVDILLTAIGYPDDDVRTDGAARIISVDDADIRLEEYGTGQVRFSRTLKVFDAHAAYEKTTALLSRMAGYAAGRLLKEEAVLAWDDTRHALILWQSADGAGGAGALTAAFNLFLASCDWWNARIQDEAGTSAASARGSASPFPEMFIRP